LAVWRASSWRATGRRSKHRSTSRAPAARARRSTALVVAVLSAAELEYSDALDGWLDALDAESRSCEDIARLGGDDALVLLLRDFAARAEY
jgi:hypothetical protein